MFSFHSYFAFPLLASLMFLKHTPTSGPLSFLFLLSRMLLLPDSNMVQSLPLGLCSTAILLKSISPTPFTKRAPLGTDLQSFIPIIFLCNNYHIIYLFIKNINSMRLAAKTVADSDYSINILNEHSLNKMNENQLARIFSEQLDAA